MSWSFDAITEASEGWRKHIGDCIAKGLPILSGNGILLFLIPVLN